MKLSDYNDMIIYEWKKIMISLFSLLLKFALYIRGNI